ncbi:MAG: hypothetical protein BRC51_13425 [Cyanobacteria bacterium SW_12_48_29]|nr:MAG: hypothetical protein BRC51_13425 [Cyanobacteria bacterium SW_12_48_29]PSP16971.1 MAG: hypothetical protein BRC52_14100 [Cyanobacteria bacterium SW_5_48_44]
MLWWLKTGQAQQVNQLTHLSGYHRTTVSKWLSKYRQAGLDALLVASEARATHRYNWEDSAAVSARTPRPRRKKPAIKKYSGGCTLFVECRCLTLAVHKTVRYHLKAKLKQPRTCYGHLTGANSVRAPFPPEKNPQQPWRLSKKRRRHHAVLLSEPQQHQYGGGFVSGVPMRVG